MQQQPQLRADYDASVEALAGRGQKIDQKIAELRMSPEERAAALTEMKAQGQALDAANPDSVDRVSTIATEKTRAVKMALDKDKITLSVTSPENGTAAEEVSGQYSSDSFEIGFNARYLMDILGEIEGDIVELHLADASAPTLIRENDKSAALYVLMPMRV